MCSVFTRIVLPIWLTCCCSKKSSLENEKQTIQTDTTINTQPKPTNKLIALNEILLNPHLK